MEKQKLRISVNCMIKGEVGTHVSSQAFYEHELASI